MPFNTPSLSVGVAATQIFSPSTGSAGDPIPVIVANNDPTTTLFIGGPGVTAGNGFPIYPKSGIGFRLIAGDILFGISPAGNLDVRVLVGRQ